MKFSRLPAQEGQPGSFKVSICSMAPHYIEARFPENYGFQTSFIDIKIVLDFPEKSSGYFEFFLDFRAQTGFAG